MSEWGRDRLQFMKKIEQIEDICDLHETKKRQKQNNITLEKRASHSNIPLPERTNLKHTLIDNEGILK